ncbi:MAG: hypothetical protein GXO77_13810 [Calditrichaeota bacterium]|nr:hypothetical protein [Calditrichota bacterium]
MENLNEILRCFGALFSYPHKNYKKDAESLNRLLSQNEERYSAYRIFYDYADSAPLPEIEELFTYTFDMNPSTCLEIGWHLYGEDYQRGEFLVNMRRSLRDYRIKESVELPDHLSHCLFLLSELEKEEASEFVNSYLIKPLRKISRELDEKNPYKNLTEILLKLFEDCFRINQTNNAEIFAE